MIRTLTAVKKKKHLAWDTAERHAVSCEPLGTTEDHEFLEELSNYRFLMELVYYTVARL